MLRKIAYVWMFLTFAMASPAQTQSVFLQPTSLDPSNGNGYLSGAAVADFNGDGKPDIAYRDGTVWLAKADGTYQTTTSWCSTGQPYCQQQAVFAADVNQDGKQDLVVATSNYVWVLLGKGDGTFQAAVNSITGTSSINLYVVDVNGDGKPDAILNNAGGSIAICLGKGDGTFQAAIAGPTVPSGSTLFGVADVNGDHKVDLVEAPCAGTSLQVCVYTGNGDGTFANVPVVTNTGLQFASVYFTYQLADMDGDGKLDVVLSEFPSGVPGLEPFDPTAQPQGSFLALGKGDGTFASATQIAARGGQLAVGDLNGDGVPDLILTGSGVDVYVGTGGGAVALKGSYFASPNINTAAVIADFNGDGKADAFTGGTLLLGNGDGTLKANPVTYFAAALAPAAAADFNQDGKADLAVTVGADNKVHILVGDGSGGFTEGFVSPALSNPFSSPTGIGAIQAADVNGDGKIDLAVVETGAPGWCVYVLTGNGDGTFNAAVAVAQSSQFTLYSMVLSDLNNDHILDLVVTDNTGAVNVFLGTADGSFTPGTSFSSGITTAVTAVAGDFNGDGKADLLVSIGTAVNFLPGKGDGTFGTAVTATTLLGGVTAVGDFNGDGILDLCGIDTAVLGNGDGTFRAGSTISNAGVPVPQQVTYTIAADLNGDGKADLVGTSSVQASQTESGIIRYALSNGDGTFTPVTLVPSFTNNDVTGPLVADVNGDGRPDVVFSDSNTIVSMLNVTPPPTPDFSTTVTGASSSNVTAGESASFGFNVAPVAGFAQTVNFTCSGAPANSTCMVSPTSAMVTGSAPVAIKVTVATTASGFVSPISFQSSPKRSPWSVGAVAVFALLLMLVAILTVFEGTNRRLVLARTRWAAAAACSLVLVATNVLMVSCGGGSSSSGGSQSTSTSGTAAGSYTIKVTGTSGSGASAISHTVTFTLTVQ
jgi:FG-GAP-like repeat